jgi:NAD(P)-dependent dehydrogenase (short-subunit alcohol dehydrogenase family)
MGLRQLGPPGTKLFLSRDRVGVRPLFYAKTGHIFIFASEIKSILACPEIGRAMDLHALDQLFTFWVTLPPRTIFKDVQELPPSCLMTSTFSAFTAICPNLGLGVYCATESALNAISKAARLELKDSGVHVMTLYLGHSSSRAHRLGRSSRIP